jgi:hypothetical protein
VLPLINLVPTGGHLLKDQATDITVAYLGHDLASALASATFGMSVLG